MSRVMFFFCCSFPLRIKLIGCARKSALILCRALVFFVFFLRVCVSEYVSAYSGIVVVELGIDFFSGVC